MSCVDLQTFQVDIKILLGTLRQFIQVLFEGTEILEIQIIQDKVDDDIFKTLICKVLRIYLIISLNLAEVQFSNQNPGIFNLFEHGYTFEIKILHLMLFENDL